MACSNSHKPKVLLINNFHYRKGGSETVYFNIAHLLKNNGYEVKCFSFIDDNIDNEWRNDYFTPRANNKACGILSYINNSVAARNLERLLSAWHPDIAHVHLFWGGLSSSILPVLKKHGVKVVHTAHDYRMVCPAYTFRDGNGKICEKCSGGRYYKCVVGHCAKGSVTQSLLMSLEMYYRQLFRNPADYLDGIIYVSRFSKEIHERMDARLKDVKNVVLYNFTNPQSLVDTAASGDYFLYFGRLSAEKGVKTLVDAFIATPSLQLKIVGDGPLRKELEIRALGADNIEFCGYKTGTELIDYIYNSSWVVVPSEWYENNPMSIIEAFSYGKPVIGSKIGGIPELIGHCETGLMFKSADVSSLKSAILKAGEMTDAEYNILAGKAYDRYVESFSESAYLDRLCSFYSEQIESM